VASRGALDEQGGEVQLRGQRHPFVGAQHHQRRVEGVGAAGEASMTVTDASRVRQWTPGTGIQNVRDPLATDFTVLPVSPRPW
jgi:hypothetical protein